MYIHASICVQTGKVVVPNFSSLTLFVLRTPLAQYSAGLCAILLPLPLKVRPTGVLLVCKLFSGLFYAVDARVKTSFLIVNDVLVCTRLLWQL